MSYDGGIIGSGTGESISEQIAAHKARRNTNGTLIWPSKTDGQKAHAANPILTAEEWNNLQLILDLAGMIPGIGTGADLINAAIYAVKGDMMGAVISTLSAVPVAGDAVGAVKMAGQGQDYLNAIIKLQNKILPKLSKKYPKIVERIKELIKLLKKRSKNKFRKNLRRIGQEIEILNYPTNVLVVQQQVIPLTLFKVAKYLLEKMILTLSCQAICHCYGQDNMPVKA